MPRMRYESFIPLECILAPKSEGEHPSDDNCISSLFETGDTRLTLLARVIFCGLWPAYLAMDGEDPEVIARLRLLAPPTEWILLAPGDGSQFSCAPETRGILGDEFAIAAEPLRGALEAFPFVTGLGLRM